MKKKLICLLCVLVVIFLTASSTVIFSHLTPPANWPPSYQATVEYGETDLIFDDTGPLWAYISFPVVGDANDEIIAAWAQDTYQNARDKVAALRKNDREAHGVIGIHFDSYLVGDRYAGILEEGTFINSGSEYPINIVRTFNIDTETGMLLKSSDILDYAQLESILFFIRERIIADDPDAANSLGEMNASWLEHIVVSHDGVAVIMERGAFLPANFDTLKITIPYESLGSAFLLRESPPEGALPEPPMSLIIPNFPPLRGDIDPTKPMVALTFDDGPSRQTLRILDVLEKHGGRVTFCVIGSWVNAKQNTIRRAFGMGCEIVGHSWNHRNLSKLTEEEIRKQISDTNAAIELITGVAPRWFRPPYGAVNDRVRSVSEDLGCAIIKWSIDPNDWKVRDANKVHDMIMANVHDRAIILSHDLYGSTAAAMERVIPELIAKGYQLVTVSELMYYSGTTLVAGRVYTSGK